MEVPNKDSDKDKVKLAIHKIHKQFDELITELVEDNPENKDLQLVYEEFHSMNVKTANMFNLFKLLEKVCAITKTIKTTSEQKDKEFLIYVFSKIKIIDFNMLKNAGINEKQKEEIISFESDIIKDVSEVQEIGKNEEKDLDEFKEKVINNTQNIKTKINSFITNQTLLIDEQEKNIKEQNETISLMKKEMEKMQQKLNESIQCSFTDSLTGLKNRRSFDKKAKEYDLLWNENKSNIYYVIVDIDFFKKVNDEHGHSVGDKVLSSLGSLFLKLETTNKNINCFRYGGEEFVISIKDIKYNEVLKLVKNIKASIAKRAFDCGNVKIPITISMGVSFFCKNNENSTDVINLADQALYKAKEKRNSIYVLSDKNEKTKIMK